MHAGFEIVYLL